MPLLPADFIQPSLQTILRINLDGTIAPACFLTMDYVLMVTFKPCNLPIPTRPVSEVPAQGE